MCEHASKARTGFGPSLPAIHSGDVSIFYRAFGARGAMPVISMHGANYFDTRDWIGVAGALASNREVVAIDRRR